MTCHESRASGTWAIRRPPAADGTRLRRTAPDTAPDRTRHGTRPHPTRHPTAPDTAPDCAGHGTRLWRTAPDTAAHRNKLQQHTAAEQCSNTPQQTTAAHCSTTAQDTAAAHRNTLQHHSTRQLAHHTTRTRQTTSLGTRCARCARLGYKAHKCCVVLCVVTSWFEFKSWRVTNPERVGLGRFGARCCLGTPGVPGGARGKPLGRCVKRRWREGDRGGEGRIEATKG